MSSEKRGGPNKDSLSTLCSSVFRHFTKRPEQHVRGRSLGQRRLGTVINHTVGIKSIK